MSAPMDNERGIALGLVLIATVIFGIAAFGLLFMAMSQSQQQSFLSEDRLRARYAAEAGLVMAMQEMWQNDCVFGAAGNYLLDTDNDGTNETTVTVTMTPACPPAAATPSKLQAKVTWVP